MGLVQLDYTITPTPSGFIDGHFPNGNDGTGGIPLVWNPVPDFRKKQVGTPFSVDLFGGYLTQAGGATASVGFGTLPAGWTLNSAGLLSYSGTGIGITTLQVVATISGQTPSSSNLFTIESINTIASADTLAPTIPTGLQILSTTPSGGVGAGRIQVQCDCPSDLATATIPSSGMSEVVFTLNNAPNGAIPTLIGLQLQMLKADISAGGSTRKWFPGFYSDISFKLITQAGGIPNASGSGGGNVPIIGGSPGFNIANITIDSSAPVPNLGDTVVVSGVNPSGYNTAGAVIGSVSTGVSGTSISYPVSGSPGTYVSGGTASYPGSGSGGGGVSNVGPVCKGTNGVICRIPWSALEGPTQGTYTFSLITKILGQAAAFVGNPVVVFVMIIGRTFDGTDPAPAYMNHLSSNPKVFAFTQSGNPGYNMLWWDPFVLTRFNALVTAMGLAFDANPSFAGIATQETSLNNPPASYNATAYQNAIVSMDNYIATACPTSRHWCYENFIQAAAGAGIASGDAMLDVAVSQMQANGTIVGGPDFITNDPTNSVVTRCYPRLGGYHYGITVTQPGQTPTKFLSTGPTSCAIENAEQKANVPPLQTGTPDVQANIFLYAHTGVSPGKGPLNLDLIAFQWGLGTNKNGENFSTWAANIIQQHTVPFGTWTPSGSLPTGNVVQSGVNYAVTGSGHGVLAASDEWTAARVNVNGDFTIIAELASMSGTNTSTALGGISIREDSNANARACHIIVGRTTLYSAYRASRGGALTTLQTAVQNWTSPKWLKIQKLAGTFYFWYATSPNSWISLGTVVLSMQASNFAECFACCNGQSTPVTVQFNQVNVQNLASPVYTYLNLSAGSYSVNAYAQDLAGNQSVSGTALTVAIS